MKAMDRKFFSSWKRSLLLYFILLVFLPISMIGQNYQPKEFFFGTMKAKAVKTTNPILKLSGSPRSLPMIKKVGGVAFESIAIPDERLEMDTIILNYDSNSTDGQRLKISLKGDNGEVLYAQIPDWQLLPIAEFSESNNTALVSFYGAENYNDLEYLDNGHNVVYHESIINTLLGLRLFQADLLLSKKTGSLWNLPQADFKDSLGLQLILGTGEEKFRPDSNNIKNYVNAYKNIQWLIDDDYESYILTDHESDIRFSQFNNQLIITGEPYYLFNKTKPSNQSYFEEIYYFLKTIEDTSSFASDPRIKRLEDIVLKERYSWNVEEAIIIIRDLSNDYINWEDEKANEDHKEIINMLKNLIYLPNEIPDIQDCLTEKMRANNKYAYDYNPAVMNSAIQTVRFAAFFRYVKKTYPDTWNDFMHQIRSVNEKEKEKIYAKLYTPTKYSSIKE